MSKTFLVNDIDHPPLRNWIKRKCQPVSHKVKDGYLFAVYETITVIEALKASIKQHKNTSAAKYIPAWESYIREIKGL